MTSRVALRTALVSAFVAVAACDCEGENITSAGPHIKVDPESVTIEAVAGRPSEVFLKLSNTGNSGLILSKDPYFVDDEKDGELEFGVFDAMRESCEGVARPEDGRRNIPSGGCAIVGIRYVAKGDGVDVVTLRFESNDSDFPTFDVPVNASALTPDLEVCAFDGTTPLGCNEPGFAFDVDHGTAQPGEKITRTLKLTSKGSRTVKIQGAELVGASDFAFTPEPYVKDLAAGETDTITVTFSPAVGGPREATLTLSTNDPGDEHLAIHLIGYGDDAKLCLCVRGAEGACRSYNADFGDVPVGGSGQRWLRLSSCGSKPMTLQTMTLSEGAEVFTATLPTLPTTMAAGAPYIEIPLGFKPPSKDTFNGRLAFQTTNERGFVLLTGRGVESGCKLAAPATIDFGQAGVGIPKQVDFAVSNQGTGECVIPSIPTITRGADVAFALAGFPLAPIVAAAGQTVHFKVGYTPADVTGPDTGELTVPYADSRPGSPQATLTVQLKGSPVASPKCVLVAAPNDQGTFGRTLNFGQVRVNTEKILPVTFRNTGSAPCNVTSASIVLSGVALPGTPDDRSAFKIKTPVAAGGLTVAPGASTSLDIGFTPKTDRDYGTLSMGTPIPIPGLPSPIGVKLKVATNDTDTFDGQSCSAGTGTGPRGCVGWNLAGKGARSDLQVLPPDLKFGLVTLGCRSREETVTLYNVGGVPIEITEIKVDPVQNPEVFHVVSPPVPFTMQGNTQRQITVRYRPPDTAIHTASIFIKSNATNVNAANPYTTISLTGQGTTDTHQVDRFDQNTRPKTDVLFIVDNSGSMSEEQSALANNAQRFVGVASQLNTDFQLGVVTTDMDEDKESGRLQGNPKIVLPGASAASQFASTVRARGTNGSGDEKGLAAMVAALSDPLINDPTANQGFLRDDAKLSVIIVSDEEDGSSGTIDFYTDFLKNIKGIYNQSLVTFSAIVGESGGCTSNNGDAVGGDRYIEVQRRTNGQFRSICSADWGQVAADLGLDAFGARAGFPLSRLADPPTIKVTVNGAASPATNWSYDPGPNAVVFNTGSAPPAGAVVVIEYDALCL